MRNVVPFFPGRVRRAGLRTARVAYGLLLHDAPIGVVAEPDVRKAMKPSVPPPPTAPRAAFSPLALPYRPPPESRGGRSASERIDLLPATAPVLICLSHLRWDFVFQRPQHLLTRFAAYQRVFYVEEPVIHDGPPRLLVSRRAHGLHVVTPQVPAPPSDDALQAMLRALMDRLFLHHDIDQHVLWFYTPMAVPSTTHLRPGLVVYDCMDELSAFAGAPPAMREQEAKLMAWADLVFTGGHSLHAAKRDRHPHVHAFPSSIDQAHFAQARTPMRPPTDQAAIPGPRIGFYGVVDERFDRDLLDGIARLQPDWHFVVIGPVVKIDPASLPQRDNIHYLGRKDYRELPAYLAGWDAAMLPFARNDATRFISPTKTPEYLCAGRPVVSTSIADVVSPYGDLGLVRIADEPAAFVAAIAAAIDDGRDPAWWRMVDGHLGGNSWDRTWEQMRGLMIQAAASKGHPRSAIFPVG